MKGPNQFNCIKNTFAQCDKNSAFCLLTASFPRANLPSTTWFLRSVMAPSIKKKSDNLYQYFLCHFENGLPLVKGIEFDQSSSTVLVAPTLRLAVAISSSYHLTIVITDVNNAFQNNFKASSEHEISWFTVHFPTIRI